MEHKLNCYAIPCDKCESQETMSNERSALYYSAAENAEKTGNSTFEIQKTEFVLFTRNNSSLR